MADTGHLDPDRDLAGAGVGQIEILEVERRPDRSQHRRFHIVSCKVSSNGRRT